MKIKKEAFKIICAQYQGWTRNVKARTEQDYPIFEYLVYYVLCKPVQQYLIIFLF